MYQIHLFFYAIHHSYISCRQLSFGMDLCFSGLPKRQGDEFSRRSVPGT